MKEVYRKEDEEKMDVMSVSPSKTRNPRDNEESKKKSKRVYKWR